MTLYMHGFVAVYHVPNEYPKQHTSISDCQLRHIATILLALHATIMRIFFMLPETIEQSACTLILSLSLVGPVKYSIHCCAHSLALIHCRVKPDFEAVVRLNCTAL